MPQSNVQNVDKSTGGANELLQTADSCYAFKFFRDEVFHVVKTFLQISFCCSTHWF